MDHANAFIDFDKELSEGSLPAIVVCLRLKPEEKLRLSPIMNHLRNASSLVAEMIKVGAEYSLMVIEDYSSRPLKNMPQPILDDLAKAKVVHFLRNCSYRRASLRIDMTELWMRIKYATGMVKKISTSR